MASVDEIRFWPATDVGISRDHNEDCFLVDKKLGLFVVADGMGGHAAGEVASDLAVHAFRDALHNRRDALAAYDPSDGGESRNEILRLLEAATQQACAAVHADAEANPARRGMGTTMSALLLVTSEVSRPSLVGDAPTASERPLTKVWRAFIAHVGDSRVYLIRGGAAHQLTEDHSLINELLRRGRLTRDQIEKIEYKNAVTRAVGVYESVEVDTLDLDVLAGDRFLLCSDGLHRYLEPEEAVRILAETKEEELASTLINFANASGGEDNITAVVVGAPDVQPGTDALARELNLKLDTLRKMPLFKFLSYQELVRVLNITTVSAFSAGEPIVKQGDAGDELFLVLSGDVKVHSGDTLITKLGAGQHFGEMALVDKAPRSASVTSETDSKLLSIRRRDFFDLVRKDHDVAVKLLWSFVGVLTERLRATSRELGEAREQLSLEDLTHEILGNES